MAGTPVDDRTTAKVQDTIRGLDARLPMHDRALTVASRRVGELEQARAVRAEGLLTPLFIEVIAQLDAQAEVFAGIEDLLARAHRAAINAIPSSQTSPLVHGYCVFGVAERLSSWRARVVAAGLLPAKHPSPGTKTRSEDQPPT